MSELGSRIKEIREARGLTQKALAERIPPDDEGRRVHRPSITMLENGVFRNPGALMLKRLAAALEVSVDDLLAEPGLPFGPEGIDPYRCSQRSAA
jgi:transcriptional regulator with XRE-family HTH domain